MADDPLIFVYENHKGLCAERTVRPISIWYGSTEWYPEPQWFLKAHDEERKAERDFACSRIQLVEMTALAKHYKRAIAAAKRALHNARGLLREGKSEMATRKLAEIQIQLQNDHNTFGIVKEGDPPEACPCLHTKPCHTDCTCLNRYSSHGCTRCCSWLDDEQKAERAVDLAAAIDQAKEE